MSNPTARPKKPEPTKTTPYANIITPAQVDWQSDDKGNQVPVSGEFGDVYYSQTNGLAESRYVFLEGNHLAERLARLTAYQTFSVAELGFGTGLNVLALWHLWRELRAKHAHLSTARLHIITTEKHPIPLTDLTQILGIWCQRAPELRPMVAELLTAYPILIAGCHRLNFAADNLTLDIWLGDAADSLAKLATDNSDFQSTQKRAQIDAWFLDGFAPSCNESLWAESIFVQIERLSSIGTTAATYSCAGVVKRGLQSSGFELKKLKGFGPKNEMLTAEIKENIDLPQSDDAFVEKILVKENPKPNHTLIIGAGIAGLMSAWSLANRGIKVTVVDKTAPLAGASGNPRALLAPKMTPIHHAAEHLHTIGYLYSSRLYHQLNVAARTLNAPLIIEPTGALDLLLKANIDSGQISNYPNDMATTLADSDAKAVTGLREQDLCENLYLPQSGLVNPQALKAVILAHPLITFKPFEVVKIEEEADCIRVSGHTNNEKIADLITIQADNVVICAAYESHYLDQRIFDCRKIRGQLSWFTPTTEQLAQLPKLPLKYGGYCALFNAQADDTKSNQTSENDVKFLLGASFVRNDIATDIRLNEHQVSRDKLIKAIPELDAIIPTDTQLWQARAGVRTQTPDYHPIVGRLAQSTRLWVLSAMGAKGYAYAPICAQALAAMMLGEFAPLSEAMLERVSPDRKRLKTPLNES
ncbi:tRNA (5-methylaminomethyl-2-thiouridine)(34)-methyltransferase MnmD [Psychrobacter sp. DM4]|uniref:tRNA (5-methylaminomethyl-2-thiouridine)(34)-methyltransferase MnmD n=1 Tax=Psychrobacter sp. DM4 TaxID=3440637 RepID=UPI003F4F95E0